MSMAIQQIALLLSLLPILASGDGGLAVSTPSPLISKTCVAIHNYTIDITYDECVDTLSAVPASASAKDTRELAVIAANLTAANVTSTVLVLDDLVKNLGWCLKIYRGMSSMLAAAIDDFRAGNDFAASERLLDATEQPDDCDILLFQGSAKKNPMSQEDAYANLLSDFAYAISMVVLNPPGPIE